MAGYDPDFLPVTVPLPQFMPNIAGHLLRREALRDGVFADYVNYTVAMHDEFRTLLFAALNIDQKLKKQTDRSDDWRVDSRIGADNQLNNDYYANNPWDRGHLARRATAGWGETNKLAQRAADETFYYSNAALQHKNLNRDEWLALEDWVLDLKIDIGDKISVFSGPVFGDFMRTIRPSGRAPAFVPSAFFKVVFFMNKSGDLEVRAFLVKQDSAAMRDMRGRRTFDHQFYQVSVAEIEALTGLDFPELLPERNPMFYAPSDNAHDVNVHEFPERREIDVPEDIVRDNETPRTISFADDEIDVFIAAALVNPKGHDSGGEWVSIANLSSKSVAINGWKLSDDKKRVKELKGSIGPGEAIRIQPLNPVMLANNRNGFIQLVDDQNRQIDRVPYTKEQAMVEGKPLVFAYRDLDYEPRRP